MTVPGGARYFHSPLHSPLAGFRVAEVFHGPELGDVLFECINNGIRVVAVDDDGHHLFSFLHFPLKPMALTAGLGT